MIQQPQLLKVQSSRHKFHEAEYFLTSWFSFSSGQGSLRNLENPKVPCCVQKSPKVFK
jgi:hypothetical protein